MTYRLKRLTFFGLSILMVLMVIFARQFQDRKSIHAAGLLADSDWSELLDYSESWLNEMPDDKHALFWKANALFGFGALVGGRSSSFDGKKKGASLG